MQHPPLQDVRTEHENILTRPAHQPPYSVSHGSGLPSRYAPAGPGRCSPRWEVPAGPFSPTPLLARRGSGRPAQHPPRAERAAEARPGALRSPWTRLPSGRSVPNGRAALGPSASPHVAPPRASLPLAVARSGVRGSPLGWPDRAAAWSGVGGERP